MPLKPSTVTDRAEGHAAAQDAPVDGALLAGLEPHEQGAGDRNERDDQAEQKDLVVGEMLRKPSRKTGNREDSERQRQPPEHLHHAEIVVDLLLQARRSVGIVARHDLRAHGVGHDVLQHHARHADERGDDVDPIGRQRRDPAAGGARQQDERKGDQAGADENVGAALGAEQRHGVDELAEHHFYGPRQGEPDGQRGELRRGPGQGVLDPEALGDADEAHRSIREINHQQRQVLPPQGADRRQQRILDLLPPIGGRCGLAGVHGCRLPPGGSLDHAGLPMPPQAPLCPCPHGSGASATQSIYKLSKTAPPAFSRREDVFR